MFSVLSNNSDFCINKHFFHIRRNFSVAILAQAILGRERGFKSRMLSPLHERNEAVCSTPTPPTQWLKKLRDERESSRKRPRPAVSTSTRKKQKKCVESQSGSSHNSLPKDSQYQRVVSKSGVYILPMQDETLWLGSATPSLPPPASDDRSQKKEKAPTPYELHITSGLCRGRSCSDCMFLRPYDA